MRNSLVILCALVLSAGCTRGGSQTAHEVTMEDLRNRAAANPHDAEAVFAWAEGEILRPDGDPSRAEEAISRAIAVGPNDSRTHFLAGLEQYHHGHPAQALSHLLDAIERAPSSHPGVAEASALMLRELSNLAPNYPAATTERLQAVLPQLPIGARAAIGELLVDLAYRRGDAPATQSLAAEMGCLTDWRVAGPIGPRDLLGFDQTHEIAGVGAMPAQVDLGVGRGTRPVRAVEARGCAVHLGEGPVNDAGTTYAETFVEIDEPGDYTLRLETPNSIELSVDGESIVRLDHRRQPLRRTTFHRVRLGAGRHEIEIKLTTRHPNPVLLVSLAKGEAATTPPEGAGLACYLRASMRVGRGNPTGAREALRSDACTKGAATLVLQASTALEDPYQSSDMNRDEARRLFREAMDRDPAMWVPVMQMARLSAAEGRDQEAIAQLQVGLEHWSEVIAIRMALIELLLNRGWDAGALEHIETAMQVAPGTCGPIYAALAHAQRRDRIADIDTYIEQAVSCDARNNARFALRVAARNWDAARVELDRLASLEPSQARNRFLSSRLDLAEGRASAVGIEEVLAELQTLRPRSPQFPLQRADLHWAQGNHDVALAVLDEAINAEPTAMAELRRVRRALGGTDELESFRMDGRAIIDAFEASGHRYDSPQALVFDYTAIRVFDDGSSLALTHQIYRALSEEAVDELGQFAPPDSGYVLTLHTVKADGSRLEPDLISGTDSINLPTVSVGDYVESEYVRVLDPPVGLPGGLLGDRFYFASAEVPFYRSELVVATPPSMTLVADPRGDAPRQVTTEDAGLRIHRWRVDQAEPIVVEPMSVAGREWVPSVNWGIRATWGRFLGGLRDVLADRNPVDPAAVRLARRVTHDATTDEQKARKLYYWVLEHIENNNDVFGIAPIMLATRTGNRTRVLHYLLGLIGVESELLLVRGANEDQTRSDVADEDTYNNLVMRVGETYLVTSARGTPYGYISPLLRGQDALVLSGHEQTVERIEIPPASPGIDRQSIEILATLSETGAAVLEFTETVRGSGAIGWRSNLENIPEATLQDRFEEGYAARLIPGARLTALRISGREEAEAPLVLRYTLETESLARQQGDRLILPGFLPSNLTARYAQVGSRTTTELVVPMDIDITVRIRAEGANAVQMPNVELDGPQGAQYRATTRAEGDDLVIQRSVRVPLMRVAPDDYPAFARWARAADQAETREVALP